MITEALIVEGIYIDIAGTLREDCLKEQRRQHAAHIREIRKQRDKERGYPIHGNAPFGYRWDCGTLVPCVLELEVIALAQQLRTNGLSYREIATVLKEKGYRSRTGNIFNVGHVYSILNNKRKSLVALLPKE